MNWTQRRGRFTEGLGRSPLSRFGARHGITPVVAHLMVLNIALWLLMWLSDAMHATRLVGSFNSLALYPAESPLFRPWQLVSYMFLHGGSWHLFFNMFALWMFGRFIEWDLGPKRFLLFYLVCGVGAGLIQLLVCWLTGASLYVPTVGASGAIYALLMAFGMLHPNDIIMPMIPPIPMKAKWAVLIFIAIELFLGVRSFRAADMLDNVAHFAHLGGMLWGFGLLWLWKKQRRIYF